MSVLWQKVTFDCCVLFVCCSPCSRTVTIQIWHRWKKRLPFIHLDLIGGIFRKLTGVVEALLLIVANMVGGGATNSNILVVAVVLICWPVIVNHCYGRTLLNLRLSLSVKGSMIITNDLSSVPYDLLRSNEWVFTFYSS
jgi:hypothetical protein